MTELYRIICGWMDSLRTNHEKFIFTKLPHIIAVLCIIGAIYYLYRCTTHF